MDKQSPNTKPEHPSIKLFRLIPGPSHRAFGRLLPSSAKLWMALFAHACKHGQWLAPNPERLLPAALHAEWTLAEIAKAARLNEKTVLTCLTNLTECWVIVHDLKETMVSYYLLPAPRDLASIVVTALTLHSALDLPDLTEQVLRLGYKTHSQNLAQAIYNILSKLKKEGRVNRNHDKKTYSLIVTDL